MAEPPKFPGPVTMNEDDPKKGFTTLFLSVPGLRTKKAYGFVGKEEAINATVTEEFSNQLACVTVAVKDSGGKETVYQYRKNLPEDIDAKATYCRPKKDQVVVHLCKAEQNSWAQHTKHLTKKE